MTSLVWIIVRSLTLGIGAGIIGFLLVLLLGVEGATRRSFSVFGLLFGVALIGWSVAITSTQAIQKFAEIRGKDTDWKEGDVRQAMTALCYFGLGGMMGVYLGATVLGFTTPLLVNDGW